MIFENWKLDRLETCDAAAFFNLIQKNKTHLEQTFPVTLQKTETLEKALLFFDESTTKEQNGEGYYFYIRNLKSAKLIGYICIKNVVKSTSKCELAYFIDQDYEGQGIISKAVSQTIAFCFDQLGMNKIFICTSLINLASQRIAIKNGFAQEGILRQEFRRGDGVLEDILYFGLLKSDTQ